MTDRMLSEQPTECVGMRKQIKRGARARGVSLCLQAHAHDAVEQLTVNQLVVGSIPTAGAKSPRKI